jgi:DNA-binding beta-propeller fold protein YncE
MRKVSITQAAIGAMAILAWGLLSTVSASQASTVKFISTDEPGPWFKCTSGFDGAFGCVPFSVAKSQSLAIIKSGDIVEIDNGRGNNNVGIDTTNTVHTFTSLLYPKDAQNMPFDQPLGAFRQTRIVQLHTPGLYVFVCKLHPFMLAATIVDDNSLTAGLELGSEITLLSKIGNTQITVPTSSDLATRLLRAFFLITNPKNYQDYNIATNPTRTWHIEYPNVDVKTNLPPLLNLKTVLEGRYGNDSTLPTLFNPSKPGVGEIWVDAEYEKTAGKTKPGSAIAVNALIWKVVKRFSLPSINMNNPHNMWTNRDQTRIYQTQWFGDKLTVFNRITGRIIRNITVGEAPAHVMTRVDSDQVHVSLNGAASVEEYNPGSLSFSRSIPTQYDGQNPAQPHAHWMSFDGHTMVTPNSNTNDSTRIDLVPGTIADKTLTGTLPIATGMMPDASKYYVSNYLDNTITCVSIGDAACNNGDNKVAKKDINLLLGGSTVANYDPGAGYSFDSDGAPLLGMSQSGALPIQTPVSPDGKFVITGNTLSGTITIIDTSTDTLVKVLPCSAGCHGVNFGAKFGGGYYAYVTSKFSNDLIIVDYDPNNNGNVSDAKIAGRVALVAGKLVLADDKVSAYAGMGGQGVLPIPLVYNGWVQKLPRFWKFQLTHDQRHPFPQTENGNKDDDE